MSCDERNCAKTVQHRRRLTTASDWTFESAQRRFIERGVDYLLDRARLLGRHTGSWAEAMYQQRGIAGVRVLHGLLHLAEKHPVAALERAAAKALRTIGKHPADEAPVELFEGRYGPYVKHGGVNATVPRDLKPEELTVDQAVSLLAERAARAATTAFFTGRTP